MSALRQEILELIRLCYRASHAPARWRDFLERFAETNGHVVASLSFSRGFPDRVVGAYVSPGGEEAMGDYNENWAHRDPYRDDLLEQPDGIVVNPSCAVLPPEQLVRSEIYRGFIRPHGMGTSLAAVYKDSVRGIVSLGAFQGHLHPATEEQLRVTRAIFPHVLQALSLYREFVALKLETNALRQALEGADAGFMILDASGQLWWRNRYADELLKQGDGIELRAGTIRAIDATSAARLADAVACALRVDQDQATEARDLFKVDRPQGRPLEVIVAPLAALDLGLPEPGAGALVVVRDPDTTSSAFAQNLQTLHGLSPMESIVVEILTEGLSAANIADALNLSIHTVRDHIRSALAKTRTGSQTELVGLVTRGVAAIAPDE